MMLDLAILYSTFIKLNKNIFLELLMIIDILVTSFIASFKKSGKASICYINNECKHVCKEKKTTLFRALICFLPHQSFAH